MRKQLYTVLLMLVGAATLALPDALLSPRGQAGAGHWVIMGEDPIIIGGYGDNFTYNGNDVRRLKGYVTVDLVSVKIVVAFFATISCHQAHSPDDTTVVISRRSGLSTTVSIGSQLRVVLVHRSGRARLALS